MHKKNPHSPVNEQMIKMKSEGEGSLVLLCQFISKLRLLSQTAIDLLHLHGISEKFILVSGQVIVNMPAFTLMLMKYELID